MGYAPPDGKVRDDRPLRFDFALLVGGFIANDPKLAQHYSRSDSYALPSFHLMGRNDGIVPAAESLALAAKFERPIVVEHGGGHTIASDPEVKDALNAFLKARLRAAASREPASW